MDPELLKTADGRQIAGHLFKDGMRRCAICKTFKPLDDFNDNRSAAGGKLSYCKPCNAEYMRARKGKHIKGDQSEYFKKWYALNRERRLTKAHQEPHKRRAHQAITAALRKGTITRPDLCSKCGVSGKPLVAHHDDYSKKLEVRWLCKSCHQEHHKGNGLH